MKSHHVTITTEEGITKLTLVVHKGHRMAAIICPLSGKIGCIALNRLFSVRATSILCLLGIGLGVGSVLLYKLCTKILSPAIAAARGKKRPSSPGKLLPEHHLEAVLSPETPDSGISTATTLTGTVSSCALTPDCPHKEDVTFSQEGLRHRSSVQTPLRQISSPRKPTRFGSQSSNGDSLPHDSFCLDDVRPSTSQDLRLNHSRRSGTFCSSLNSDQGFVSGHQVSIDGYWQAPSEHESIGGHSLPADLSVARWNNGQEESSYIYGGRLTGDRVFSPVTSDRGERSHNRSSFGVSMDYANCSHSGAIHSTPQHEVEYSYSDLGDVSFHVGDKPMLRRNTYSMGSNLSASTEFSMRESLTGKGYSIDLGESLSRLGTPVSSVFDKDSIAPSSASNMDQLHREIRIIREEISEMNEKVQVLSSRENLQEMFMLTPDPMQETEFSQSLKVVQQKRAPLLSESRSCSVSVDGDAEDPSSWRRSYHHTGEFIWDYQSDLATEDSSNFVTKRPMIGESAALQADKIDYNSPTFDHVRKYIESCCNAQYDSSEASPSVHKNNRQTPKQSRTFSSITDMYIDDNFSEFGDCTDVGERNRPDGCQSMETSQIHSGENENTPKTVHNITHDALQKQLSFNKSIDCDNNGNPDTSVATYSVESEYKGGMEGSMCKECGSPSHRTKRHDSPLGEYGSYESAFRSVSSPKSLQHSRPSSATDSSSPLNSLAHRHKRSRWEVKNVNDKINIFEYAEREVKGDSPTSRVTKKGYHQISGLLGMSQIRPIRGDNYCALRATLYQICVNNFPMLKHLGPLDNILRKLTLFHDPKYSFLHSWNFANRLPYGKDSVLERIQECIVCFYKQVEALNQLPTASAREAAFMEIVNFDPDTDLQFLEAIKILMMVEAAEMYEAYTGPGRKRVPVFAWLMYSRESSENPEALFRNHINCLGDISSAQQVELFLLGHTLGVKIEVVRPARYGHEDFISHYPDDGADGYPKVYLVAENDRIYHAVMK